MRVLNINLPRQTYESNIPYALRFMVDKDIVGMGWFKINAGQYDYR
jgi:DNA polymerase delta subunit 1